MKSELPDPVKTKVQYAAEQHMQTSTEIAALLACCCGRLD